MEDIRLIKINSIPSGIDYSLIIDSFLNSKFIMLHDLYSSDTYIITDSSAIATGLSNLNISVSEESIIETGQELRQFKVFTVYLFKSPERHYQKEPYPEESKMSGVYQALRGSNARIIMAFSPADIKHATRIKKEIEHEISSIDVRVTKGMGRALSPNHSSQADVYYNSDKKKVLLSALDMLNDIIMSNGSSYKVSVIVEDTADSDKAVQYLKSKLLIFDESSIAARGVIELYRSIDKITSMPFSLERSSSMLFFSDKVKRLADIKTYLPGPKNGILIGNYVHNGIKVTDSALCIKKESMNLGAIVSGLPGSGKTASAKSIIGQIATGKETKVIIISPNGEWNQFGSSNGLRIIKIYDSNMPMNFFKCNSLVNAEKFYEDLSMLVASASNAGPYRNSIEKVLLSAFSKSYKEGKDPDPNLVYSNIELAVIEQHGKVTNTSVRYTKHGENIRAALQNLRLIISRPEFAYNNGIDFEFIIGDGAVFDLSKVSNNMKPFFYALILNQVYSFAEPFDIYGDDKLRMLICIEEAQVVFNNDISSAANQDLENRIQNFRKKGIGLFLITHNATDISPRIRRLLQFKMYFRQSADVAKYASNDLIFNECDEGEVAKKLKTLEQRTCAVSYVDILGGRKIPESSVFVEIPEITEKGGPPEEQETAKNAKLSDTAFTIKNKDASYEKRAKVQLLYLGERIAETEADDEGIVTFKDLLSGKIYELIVLGEKKKDSKKFLVRGGKSEEILI